MNTTKVLQPLSLLPPIVHRETLRYGAAKQQQHGCGHLHRLPGPAEVPLEMNGLVRRGPLSGARVCPSRALDLREMPGSAGSKNGCAGALASAVIFGRAAAVYPWVESVTSEITDLANSRR